MLTITGKGQLTVFSFHKHKKNDQPALESCMSRKTGNKNPKTKETASKIDQRNVSNFNEVATLPTPSPLNEEHVIDIERTHSQCEQPRPSSIILGFW